MEDVLPVMLDLIWMMKMGNAMLPKLMKLEIPIVLNGSMRIFV